MDGIKTVNKHTKRVYCLLASFGTAPVFMARIPNEEIERLKKEIPIERLVTGFVVELKRQGKDLFGGNSVIRDSILKHNSFRAAICIMHRGKLPACDRGHLMRGGNSGQYTQTPFFPRCYMHYASR